MTARERLEGYLGALRRRLRTHIYAEAAAAAAAGVLAITAITVWLLGREQFAPAIVFSGRTALILLLISVAVLLLWLPLRHLRRDDGAQVFEQRLPAQSGRIQTYLDNKRREAAGRSSPLIDLLAEDAANLAARTPVEEVVPARRLGIGCLVGATAALALALLLAIGPGYWGFGSRHLLLGADLPREAVPVRRVVVTPGDATVRRNSDLAIRAVVEGFDPRQVQVFVRFADQQQWERANMQPASSERGSPFEFRLYAVRAPLQYYVDAEGTRSVEHKVTVADLPKIDRVRLTYSYPEWTGLEPLTDETSRDIRAVPGTNVKVEVFADAPLDSPALIVDGQTGALQQDGSASTGTIEVKQPGHYQIGARVADEFVALSDEYAIEIVPDEKPVIEIEKPGRDWRATRIEEVPVRIQAQDDFRLRDVQLRYSVNGGDWQSMQVGGGVKQSNSESLLRLEELRAGQVASAKKLEPGDLVSYYAVAKDRKQAVQTDLFMVEVQPFERRFRQGQGAGGGGGGMSDEQGAISERQREILLATWNLQRNDERNARSRRQLEDSARMLAELQSTLAQQARTLAERTRARASVEEDERVKTFVESLERAASVMDPAARHLSEFKLREAVPVEQQALQQLLRAEAAFREVQVSMQQNDPSNGGQQAARNFTEMFELEMDLEKNQYESESQLSRRNSQQELEEAIRKLKELAERQERLAQERNRSAMRAEEQRWKQEQLRREAEDLRRRLAELDRQQREQQQQQQQSSSDSASGASGERASANASRGSQGSRSDSTRSEVANALESVNRALQDMQSANSGSQRDSQQAAESARKAGQNLRQALKQMDQPAPSKLDEALERFADRTQRLGEDQRRIESDLYEALGQGGQPSQRMNGRSSVDQRQTQQLVQSKQKMADELTALQRDMRNAVHEHRQQAPEGSQRLSEIVRDIESSDLMYRLNRSAAEIYYGRAREAAPREGLITDALETLEHDLREAAQQAAREGRQTPDGITPDALLAEVAELRRMLQAAQRDSREGARQSGEQRGTPQEALRAEASSASQRGGRSGAQDHEPSTAESTENQAGRSGLTAWNPTAPAGSLHDLQHGRGSPARQTAEIGQRVRDLANRLNRGQLSDAELEALRRTANQLRRLAGDPMAGQTEAMLKLVDQIELTALNAAARAKRITSARATMPEPDSPRYREAVAEYYRRLGDR